MNMLRESNLFQRAAAVPGHEGCVVSVFDVEEKPRGHRVRRRLHKWVNWRTTVIKGSRMFDKREHSLWNMHLVYKAGFTTAESRAI